MFLGKYSNGRVCSSGGFHAADIFPLPVQRQPPRLISRRGVKTFFCGLHLLEETPLMINANASVSGVYHLRAVGMHKLVIELSAKERIRARVSRGRHGQLFMQLS